MSIQEVAVKRIAQQLTTLVGEDKFRIIFSDEISYGKYTDVVVVEKKKRTSSPKLFDFKHQTDFYQRVEPLKPGESVTLAAPGVPIDTLQSAVGTIGARFFGKGSCITSRNKDGSVDLLRLS
jgi:hypothetical protein